MKHKRYEKIRALWNAENNWILNWLVYVQEKIDWANLSVWVDGVDFRVWSRSQDVTEKGFRWAVDYIMSHKWIKQLITYLMDSEKTKDVRLFGEWLVPHTIWDYNPESYNHFYMFDIEVDWISLSTEEVLSLAKIYDIKAPQLFYVWTNPSEEEVKKHVGESFIWPKGEWVVIKNTDFINQFGNPAYAKIVWEKFKEDNLVTFWGMQKWDNEIKIVLKYCTDWRVRKIINKIEQNEDRDIKMEDVWRVISMVQYDIIVEEVWNYSKYWVIDFKRLKGLLWKRISKMAIWIINGEATSVAFEIDNFNSCNKKEGLWKK